MGVAKDNYPRDGDTYSFVVGFAEVEVDVETGKVTLVDYLSASATSARSSTRAACIAQINGGSCLGIAHALCQKWVVRPAVRRAAGEALPLQQAADDPRHPDRAAGRGARHRRSGDAGRRARRRRAAGRRRLRRRAERDRRRDRRRRVPPRAGHRRHRADVARARTTDARALAGALCRDRLWLSFAT